MCRPTSFVHGVVCGRVFLMVAAHVQGHQLGWCVTEATGFRLVIPGDQADTVRAPDVAFVARERLPLLPPTGFARLAPDLAVEVLSPTRRRRT
jgi:Uma2 family endonuclease